MPRGPYKNPAMWHYPRIHNFEFGFGLSAEDSLKSSTIVTWSLQNNAIVDYETIKTNPENVDFAVVNYPDVCAGSVIPRIMVDYSMYVPMADAEIIMMNMNTMKLHTSFLNRLDAFDKKTGNDIETILELEHETTNETTYPIYNGTKLFEAGGTFDTTFLNGFAAVGLGTDLQPEGVAFDKEMLFDAKQYYTNKSMLNLVTSKMRSYKIVEPLVPHGQAVVHNHYNTPTPSLCKFANPYMFCGELFHLPQVGSIDQLHVAGDTTAIEHLRVKGRVRFAEYNSDFNFARA